MTNFKKKLHEIIRVDHAGEMGARVIYDGQIAALKLKKDYETLKIVEHMKEQENVHFEYFDEKMKKEKVRPTLMQPVWKVGGFALGFVTAMMDKKAAMACTTAVEETIDLHYQEQIKEVEEEISKNGDENLSELKNKIEKFRDEELEHRDIGYENHAADLKYFAPLSAFVKATTKFAIAVSKKV
jgi:ubiquinone biosynthesis monooxygenase Coq7